MTRTATTKASAREAYVYIQLSREIDNIVAIVRQWRDSFFASGVSPQDVEYLAPAIQPACFF